MSTIKKWHINIHGIAAECGADKRNCPRGRDSDGDVDHFDTEEEANRAARERLVEKHGETATVVKRQPATTAQPSQNDFAQRHRALEVKTEEVIQRATDAENAARIKYQNIQHDEEMQIEEVNRMLPGNVQMTDAAGDNKFVGDDEEALDSGVLALTDQTYPTNVIIYDEGSGNFAHYHYTQTGRLGSMTGGYRHSEEAQRVKQHLETPAVQAKIKELAMTRMKQQIAKRREIDLGWSRYDMQQMSKTSGDQAMERVSSVERFEPVPAAEHNQLTQSINALGGDVDVTEVKPRGGIGPSSYYINYDGEEGIDVTDVMTKYCTRHAQAYPESADVHRDAAAVQLERILFSVEYRRSRELIPN